MVFKVSRSACSTRCVALEEAVVDMVLDIAATEFAELRRGNSVHFNAFPQEVLDRESVRLVGRVGRFQPSICCAVTATRSKYNSASGAKVRRSASIFRGMSTPLGSWSPK